MCNILLYRFRRTCLTSCNLKNFLFHLKNCSRVRGPERRRERVERRENERKRACERPQRVTRKKSPQLSQSGSPSVLPSTARERANTGPRGGCQFSVPCWRSPKIGMITCTVRRADNHCAGWCWHALSRWREAPTMSLTMAQPRAMGTFLRL